jgi:hypothetical protein
MRNFDYDARWKRKQNKLLCRKQKKNVPEIWEDRNNWNTKVAATEGQREEDHKPSDSMKVRYLKDDY